MKETDCRISHREGIMSERGICPHCTRLAEIARKNIEGAARSKRKPPRYPPLCKECGDPIKPVLGRLGMTLPGALLLGRFFSVRDILAYWLAITLGAVLDRCIPRHL